MEKTSSKKNKDSKQKKEKLCHPQSRKASQLGRKQLRKSKLDEAAVKRRKRNYATTDRLGFYFHALPPDIERLTLEQLHELIQTVWLTRHDEEIEEEQAARKKDRPLSVKAVDLINIRARETEEYRTGLEIIDLTHPPNVALFRQWDQSDVAFLQMLRYVRINSTNPQQTIVSRPGKHPALLRDEQTSSTDIAMEGVDHAPQTTPPLPIVRLSSTMQSMDGNL